MRAARQVIVRMRRMERRVLDTARSVGVLLASAEDCEGLLALEVAGPYPSAGRPSGGPYRIVSRDPQGLRYAIRPRT